MSLSEQAEMWRSYARELEAVISNLADVPPCLLALPSDERLMAVLAWHRDRCPPCVWVK